MDSFFGCKTHVSDSRFTILFIPCFTRINNVDNISSSFEISGKIYLVTSLQRMFMSLPGYISHGCPFSKQCMYRYTNSTKCTKQRVNARTHTHTHARTHTHTRTKQYVYLKHQTVNISKAQTMHISKVPKIRTSKT